MSRPLLIGEDNPYGSDPRYALFPYPENSAGGRLCHKILQLHRAEYLTKFERVNLCPDRWSMKVAKERAQHILCTARQPVVLLGSKVSKAFGLEFKPFTKSLWVREEDIGPLVTLILPHPSGLCRFWNEPGSYDRARAMLVNLLTPDPTPSKIVVS